MKRPTAAAICFAACLATAFGAGISTVDSVDLAKYAGRWYQVYSNAYTEALIFPGAVCVTADYALDLTAGRPQVTVRNAGRLDPQEGGFNTVEGYAYVPDADAPGKLKVRLGAAPTDGDYWIGLLGPETYGADGLYEYALVTGPSGRTLFLLARDPVRFKTLFEGDVLARLAGMGYDAGDEELAPRPTEQAGCKYVALPPPEEAAAAAAPAPRGEREWGEGETAEERLQLLAEATYGRFTGPPAAAVRAADAVAAAPAAPAAAAAAAAAAGTTVRELRAEKFLGRWYQAYSNELTEKTTGKNAWCVATDYGSDPKHPERITVFNMMRSGGPEGAFGSIRGYAYAKDPSEPGQLKLQLGFIPFQGDYWIFALGPETHGEEGLYEYAVVSGPARERLFVLARDLSQFEEKFEGGVLGLLADLGFQGPGKEPKATPQAGCAYPAPPAAAAAEGEEEEEEAEGGRGLVPAAGAAGSQGKSSLRGAVGAGLRWALGAAPVAAVAELDVEKYLGRWYQAYASPSVYWTFEAGATCVYADYAARDGGGILVDNQNLKNGEPGGIQGYAYIPDPDKPGELKVHFDVAPVDGDYWVLALGPANADGLYDWAVVSDRYAATLFVLCRDLAAFGEEYEAEVLAAVAAMGFTRFWNVPVATDQTGCTNYAAAAAEEEGAAAAEVGAAAAAAPSAEGAPATKVGKVLLRRVGGDGEGGAAAAAAAAEAAPPAAVAEVARAAAAGPAGKLLGSAGGLFGGPLHASCKLKWEFATKDCTAVQAALRSAAVAMAGFEGCQEGGEKCGYSIEEESSSDNDTHLKLLHETPTKHYQDTILLEFSSGDGIMCEVEGHSSSDTWYAVLDNGTNYCNLHNLVEAAELEFKEWTSDSVCTQYSSADCLVY